MSTGAGTDLGSDATTAVGPGADETTTLGAGYGGPGAWGDDPDAATQPIPLVPRPMGDGGPERRAPRGTLLIAVALGVGVSVGLGVYSRFHEASGIALNLAGFSSGLAAKAWLASLAFVFALVQLVSALRMYGAARAGRRDGSRGAAPLVGPGGGAGHRCPSPCTASTRWGSRTSTPGCWCTRSAGCFFYGAFAAKMRAGQPGRRPEVGAAGVRRAGVHRADRDLADLVACGSSAPPAWCSERAAADPPLTPPPTSRDPATARGPLEVLHRSTAPPARPTRPTRSPPRPWKGHPPPCLPRPRPSPAAPCWPAPA